MNEQTQQMNARLNPGEAAGETSPQREGEAAEAEAVLTREGAPAMSGSGPDSTPETRQTPEVPESPVTPDDEPGADTAGSEPAAAPAQTAEADDTDGAEPCDTQSEQTAAYDREVEALLAAYPDADVERELQSPAFRALVTGTVRPTLRQAYELCHRDELTEQAVRNAVSAAVREAEENLLTHIRLRGLRPIENGQTAAGAVQTHAAVDRLTRTERADLARRAEQGDHVRL